MLTNDGLLRLHIHDLHGVHSRFGRKHTIAAPHNHVTTSRACLAAAHTTTPQEARTLPTNASRNARVRKSPNLERTSTGSRGKPRPTKVGRRLDTIGIAVTVAVALEKFTRDADTKRKDAEARSRKQSSGTRDKTEAIRLPKSKLLVLVKQVREVAAGQVAKQAGIALA